MITKTNAAQQDLTNDVSIINTITLPAAYPYAFPA